MRASMPLCRYAVTALLVVASTRLAPSARAQSSTALGLAAGAVIPLSTYSDDKGAGYHAGLVVTIRTPLSPVAFRVDGNFNELKYKGSSTKEQIWMANANVVLTVPAAMAVTPYVISGGGIYNRRRTPSLGNNSSTAFGINAGAGLRFGVGETYTFVEARYHMANGRNDIRMMPITFGVSF